MRHLILFTAVLGLSVPQTVPNNGYTWNLWLSGFEDVAHMLISERFPSVKQFITVYIDASLNDQEAQRKVEHWAAQQSLADQEKYRNLVNVLNQTHANLVTVVREGFNRPGVLSPQSQNVIRAIQRIENDRYLTIREEQRQISAMLDGITYYIQSELRQFDHKAVEVFVQRYGMPTIGDRPLFNLWDTGNGAATWNGNVGGPPTNPGAGDNWNGGNGNPGPTPNWGSPDATQTGATKDNWGSPGTTQDGPKDNWGSPDSPGTGQTDNWGVTDQGDSGWASL
uniref:DUF148 domain-containing protein n=1 Tax=Steinernema glaseri TaxID=37863 RepID=A0A1I7YL88_9BILA